MLIIKTIIKNKSNIDICTCNIIFIFYKLHNKSMTLNLIKNENN